VAVRTVLDEAYAKGELTSSPAHPAISDYVQNGESGSATKCFLGLQIAHHSQGPLDAIYERAAAALMGKVYPAAFPNPGTWLFYLVGSNSSTALNADGFAYFFFPDDDSPGSPLIVVTYRMQRIDGITTPDDFLDALPASDYYSAEADYEVYHLVIQ
jgi:hypothetical protein